MGQHQQQKQSSGTLPGTTSEFCVIAIIWNVVLAVAEPLARILGSNR